MLLKYTTVHRKLYTLKDAACVSASFNVYSFGDNEGTVVNSRLRLYRQCKTNVVNYLLLPKVLAKNTIADPVWSAICLLSNI